MTTPLDAPDLADDPELTRLLTDRADAIHPRGTTPGHLARRAGRVRHRRRAAATGVGLAATAIVASAVVGRAGNEDPQRVEAGIADGTEPATTPAPDGPETFRYAPITTTTVPPFSGTPVRLGLDVAGAEVTSASTWNGSESESDDASPMPTGVTVDFLAPDPDRHITVNAFFPNGSIMADDLPQPEAPPKVDLGDGVVGELFRFQPPPEGMEIPGYPTQVVSIQFELNGAQVSVGGAGITDDELIAVARAVDISGDPQVLVVGGMPDDLSPIEPRSSIFGGTSGPGSMVAYDLSDSLSVSVKVSTGGGAVFDDDLKHTREDPSDFQFLRTVRGTDAVVRKAAGMTSVLWREPQGELVEVYISPAGANGDPSVVPDESVVDAIVELDEGAFQDLVAAHPVTTATPPHS